MPTFARILAPAIVLLSTTACLKTNPLVWELADEAYGDGDTDTDTGTEESGDPPVDLLDGVCEVPPELEPGCGACLAESCCTSLGSCGEDAVCVCLADCLFMGDSENTCRSLCGKKPTDVRPLAPLLACAMQDCTDCFVE